MATEDKNGDLHSEKNGRYVSKTKETRDKYFNTKDTRGSFGTKTSGQGEEHIPYISLSKKEWAMWYEAIGDVERGALYVEKKNNKKMVVVDLKIIVTSGTYEKPKAEKVIKFKSVEEQATFLKKCRSKKK